jgi:hypothetical protein
LGYFYFEVISEYLMLYQETKNSSWVSQLVRW